MTKTWWSIPGAIAGIVAVSSVSPLTTESVVSSIPIDATAPTWNSCPVIVTGVPPVDGPDVGEMDITGKIVEGSIP